MNIHHLELFYHVARHRGISAAVRQMPYGIQQPAVSSQIRQLERDVNARLFDRSPFRLTRAGEELFAFIRPFFANLDAVAEKLGRHAAPTLRVGAAELLLRDYLPAVISRLQTEHRNLQITMRSGFTPELETALRQREIDVAIVPQDGKVHGLHRVSLLRLPLVLIVPARATIKTASELWCRDRIDTPLISLPEHEVITRIFRRGLKRLWVDWPCAITASSLDLIPQYVANGYGYGVNIHLPNVVNHPKVRVLPLDGFDPVEIAILWPGKTTPLIQTLLTAARHFVAENWPETARVK